MSHLFLLIAWIISWRTLQTAAHRPDNITAPKSITNVRLIEMIIVWIINMICPSFVFGLMLSIFCYGYSFEEWDETENISVFSFFVQKNKKNIVPKCLTFYLLCRNRYWRCWKVYILSAVVVSWNPDNILSLKCEKWVSLQSLHFIWGMEWL